MIGFDLFFFTALFSLLYIFLTFIFHIGLNRSYETISNIPSVSVLIAARNEEKYLPDCLNSLTQIKYDANQLEIIIINDQSSDDTEKIAHSFCQKHPNFRLLNIQKQINGLKGKMNALTQALDSARGEIIMITDADCIVPPYWIQETVKYFTEGVGLCGGFTSLTQSDKKDSLFTSIQSLDNLYLLAIASAVTGIGKPITVLGNNFAFRKKVYDQLGGFRKLGYSVTEDYLLLKAIKEKTDWQIVYPLQPQNTVYSYPLETMREFFQQRYRWLIGGRNSGLWSYFLMISAFVTKIFIFINLLLSGFNLTSFLLLLLILAFDYSIIHRLSKRLQLKYLNKYFLIYEIFYFYYSLIVATTGFLRKEVTWKNRKLQN